MKGHNFHFVLISILAIWFFAVVFLKVARAQ